MRDALARARRIGWLCSVMFHNDLLPVLAPPPQWWDRVEAGFRMHGLNVWRNPPVRH